MTGIAEFIKKEVFLPRIQKAGTMVVYDPAGVYQDICNGLADEKLLVVDASKSSIESRVAAMQGLRDVIDRQLAGILVYVPAKAPESDEERQADPFAPIAAAGAVFPEGEHVRAALPAEAAPLAGRGGVFRDLVGAGGDPEACRIRDDDRGEGRTRELAAIVAMAVHEPQQLSRHLVFHRSAMATACDHENSFAGTMTQTTWAGKTVTLFKRAAGVAAEFRS